MKTRLLLALAAAIVLLTACIPSVKPFYLSTDLRVDSRLLGLWGEKGKVDDGETWEFEQGDEKSYKLIITDKEGKQGTFNAHFFKLKEELFLDLVASECRFDPGQAELVGYSVFAGHLLLRVTQLEPSLKLAFCDFDWLAKYLEKNPGALAHHIEDKRIVLTATTSELQRFVLKHLKEGELFKQADELVRPAATPKEDQE